MMPAFKVAYEAHRIIVTMNLLLFNLGVVLKSLISTQKGFDSASLNGGLGGEGSPVASVIPACEKPLNPRIYGCAANLLALPCQTVPVRSR